MFLFTRNPKKLRRASVTEEKTGEGRSGKNSRGAYLCKETNFPPYSEKGKSHGTMKYTEDSSSLWPEKVGIEELFESQRVPEVLDQRSRVVGRLKSLDEGSSLTCGKIMQVWVDQVPNLYASEAGGRPGERVGN